MCARSVTRSSSALHKRGLGNTVVHSEKGRLVVTIRAVFSARSEITWNRNSAPTSASGTYPTSSSAINSYFLPFRHRAPNLVVQFGFYQFIHQSGGGRKTH